jgi:hypothetical protein
VVAVDISASQHARLVLTGKLTQYVADRLCSPHPPLPAVAVVGVVEEDGRFAHLLCRVPTAVPNAACLDLELSKSDALTWTYFGDPGPDFQSALTS